MQEATTAVGRVVFGSPHTKQTHDMDGALIPEESQGYSFGVAFAKNGTQHWANLAYLAPIWNEAHVAFTNGEQNNPKFSWKIVDGDSDIPNQKGTKPNTKEGYPGHWVVTFSTMLPIPCWNENGTVTLAQQGKKIEPGDYVQVQYQTQGNNVKTKSKTDGMYINPVNVALREKGVPITSVAATPPSGFGGAELPAGAQIARENPGMAVTGAPPAPAAAPPVTQVTPNAAPMNPPPPPNATAAAAVTPATPAPAAPPPTSPSNAGPVMLPAATTTYEEYKKAGWTDDQLRQSGYMQ